MKGSKEFFEELREGDEYVNCLMTKEVYSGIDFELRERMVSTTIREKREFFKEDAVHKSLVKGVSDAKKKLRDYEFDKIHG